MQLPRLLRYSGIGLILLLLLTGPFFRGLFFWTELLASIAVSAAGFILWLTGRRLAGEPAELTGGMAGLSLLVLLALYGLQFAWAVYPRGNVDWVLRVAAGWLLYVMVRAEAGPALRRWLSWALLLSGAGVAVMGFLEFAGYFARNPEMMQALGLVNLGDRMATPIQYPNTAAAYFLAILLAGAGLALEDLKGWKLAATTGLSTLISLAFFFTVSRGAVVVLPFGLLLFFLGLDRSRRWPALLLLLTAWVPMAAVLKPIGAVAAAHDWRTAFLWIGGATAVGAIGGLVLSYFLRLRFRVQAVVLVSVIAVGAMAVWAVRPAGGLLPKQAARLLDMNFRTVNVIYRLTLDGDALKMIADRPLGRGGWGWERNYRQVQTYYYVGRETHNHYLQTAVEAGVPGLLALLAAMGAALWGAWRNRSGNVTGWSLAAGAGLIAGHSVIDFNLSYGLVWFAFWVMLAAAAEPLPTATWKRPALWGSLAGTVAVGVVAGVLGLASWYTDRAESLVTAKPAEAKALAAKAARLDPLSSAPLLVIGDVPALRKATIVDPDLTNPHFELAVQLKNQEDWEGALAEARLAHQKHPLLYDHYTKLADLAGTLMTSALHDGETDRARELGAELVALGDEFARRKDAAARVKGPWMGPALQMEPVFKLRYGQALFLKGDEAGAIPYLTDAGKVGLLGSEAHVWLYAIYERQGNTKGMNELADKPWIRFRNVNPVYAVLKNWKH